jgi:predicted enzyme related to lactoylglutathione lyase
MSETAATAEQPQIDTTPGTFAWNELATSDVAGSESFYTALFDWRAETPPGMEGYKMLMVGDRPVGGLMDKSEHCDGPPVWLSYVYVADVKVSLAKALSLGANTFKEITEVPGMGTFAIIQDPQGGMIALWQKA